MIKITIKWKRGIHCDATCVIDGICYISSEPSWSIREAIDDLAQVIHDRSGGRLFDKEFVVIHE